MTNELVPLSTLSLEGASDSSVPPNTDDTFNSVVRPNTGWDEHDDQRWHQAGGCSGDAGSNELVPTFEAYGGWQFAFDYFNQSLLGGELPNVLITLTRKRGALGYFCWSCFENNQQLVTHEISLNPKYMEDRSDRDVLSTFVHEMAHLWRHEFGPLNKRGGKGTGGYHDVVWADKMDELGLPPFKIGCPKGSRTGYGVSHRIKEGGLFDQACKTLLAKGFQIDWRGTQQKQDGDGGGVDGSGNGPDGDKKPKRSKVKFTCPNRDCELNAWAKPTARLSCTQCGLEMVSELATEPKPDAEKFDEDQTGADLLPPAAEPGKPNLVDPELPLQLTKGA